MRLQFWESSVPDIPCISRPVLKAIGTKMNWDSITVNINKEIELSFRWKNRSFGEYIINRFKEYTSAQIFRILMAKHGYPSVTVRATTIKQDFKWCDIKVRWLNGRSLEYADMTGSMRNYNMKKELVLTYNQKRLIIYVPYQVTEYCYNKLLEWDPGNEFQEHLQNIVLEYLLEKWESYQFSIQIYGLWNNDEDIIYPINRSLLQ